MSEPLKFSIESDFDKVAVGLREETLKNAAMAGGEVIRSYAQINANETFKEGHGAAGLAGSMVVQVEESNADACSVTVGPTTIHGRIQELGGTIKPVFANMLSWLTKNGERVFAKSVTLPPRPYLRPAVDDHEEQIKQAVGTQIKKGVERS